MANLIAPRGNNVPPCYVAAGFMVVLSRFGYMSIVIQCPLERPIYGSANAGKLRSSNYKVRSRQWLSYCSRKNSRFNGALSNDDPYNVVS